ncbi:MAG: C4-dicarboxylate TRAP transporter substrate-binding protein [Succinivibrio dextrinosolvens]|uniref:C4-dicarboxylate TRAP transporter substrate-binding protein n=1 Tax=Succinivibrio sp. TaxID=2053619 RepID=UPI0025E50645|nr:C4-dicarboxylate TRAP transporter substrate-binding protein [Succinivibrio sp.]MBQ9220914.1 C4-dicarboxylate TRAP transporter substrate-binding protein [Succinivibrio sp.]MDY6419034.1 C4-dicarboxylate TRAP transporter substrate-binding protein [Succinivibrio dextrinosolvens]MDY6466297.1 C4-dicarboxylate TRAP transporter substrate-binding protein [Succinivibrio dextrinosolvens]
MKNILTKATLAACLAAVMTIGASAASADDTVVLRVGYGNNPGEPFDLGCHKWKELIEERSGGKFKIELYPSSQLGSKDDVMDQMVAGEPVCTLTDGAFFYDRGVKDMGIVFGPFLFDNWDQAFKLNASQWYQDQSKLVEENAHLKIIGADWKYGARHTLTTKPINKVEDFKGMKIRVPTNNIQVKGFEVLGATPTPMALGEVYTSLQQGTIDGVENPLAVLYNGKFHEVAKYLLLDGHVFNITNLVVGTDFYNSLTPEQQKLLVETCHEAGLYQNKIVEDSEAEILAKFKAEGVTVVDPSPEFKKALVETSKKFYSLPDFKDWTPGLYDTVKKAMQ